MVFNYHLGPDWLFDVIQPTWILGVSLLVAVFRGLILLQQFWGTDIVASIIFSY